MRDVLFVEGEKTADKVPELFPDLVGTTTGGKTSHKKADYSPCKGRRVFLWPDNDHDGRNQAWIDEVPQLALAAGRPRSPARAGAGRNLSGRLGFGR